MPAYSTAMLPSLLAGAGGRGGWRPPGRPGHESAACGGGETTLAPPRRRGGGDSVAGLAAFYDGQRFLADQGPDQARDGFRGDDGVAVLDAGQFLAQLVAHDGQAAQVEDDIEPGAARDHVVQRDDRDAGGDGLRLARRDALCFFAQHLFQEGGPDSAQAYDGDA